MQEKTETVFFDRDFLFPKLDQEVDDNNNNNQDPTNRRSAKAPFDDDSDSEEGGSSSTFKLPPPFALGIHITVTYFARCIKIALVDIASDQTKEMDKFRTEKNNVAVTFVNACKAPSLGAVVAAVPQKSFTIDSNGGSDCNVSTSTLLEPSAQSMLVGGVATDASGGGNSLQELLAKTVGERLIMKDSHQQKKKKRNNTEKESSSSSVVSLTDKLILVSCGIGLGAGVNPREGSEFLNSSLSNPMLAGGLVNAVYAMI